MTTAYQQKQSCTKSDTHTQSKCGLTCQEKFFLLGQTGGNAYSRRRRSGIRSEPYAKATLEMPLMQPKSCGCVVPGVSESSKGGTFRCSAVQYARQVPSPRPRRRVYSTRHQMSWTKNHTGVPRIADYDAAPAPRMRLSYVCLPKPVSTCCSSEHGR